MFTKLKIKNVIFILLVAFGIALFWRWTRQIDDGFKCIQSSLDNTAGFYSTLFFTMNHYLFCKKNKINFEMKSNNWLFKSKDGWTDYFEPVSLNYYTECTTTNTYSHSKVLEDLPIIDYKNGIKDIYIYNHRTKLKIDEIVNQFGLNPKMYDSIFIRRGDKLGSESVLLEEIEYLNLLLSKNPKCHTIFLQTDDYNCFKTLKKYMDYNKLNITLLTLCKQDMTGAIVHNHQKDIMNNAVKTNEHENNKHYLSENIDKINATKTVEDMNPSEKYNHTMDMIVGVDLCLQSNICITDYQSNVARFIKLAHNNSSNVYNILSPEKDIDYNHLICPAYGF
jgi:hypothetical protein